MIWKNYADGLFGFGYFELSDTRKYLKWLLVPLFPAVILAIPLFCIDNFIFKAIFDKKKLLKELNKIVSELNKKLPEMEAGIKKALESLKQDATI